MADQEIDWMKTFEVDEKVDELEWLLWNCCDGVVEAGADGED